MTAGHEVIHPLNPAVLSHRRLTDDSTLTGFRVRTAGIISRKARGTLPTYQVGAA